MPVPESSYVAGAKYAQVTSKPFVQGLLKNHSVGRTFIDNTNRTYNIQLKFTHLRDVLQGKKILLIDEIHTPDSSRYWITDTYEERMSSGQEPQNIDKEFLRLWFVDNCDPVSYTHLTMPTKRIV